MVHRRVNNTIDPEVLPKLDPDFVKYYNDVLALRVPTHEVPIETIRADAGLYASPWCLSVDGYERVKDAVVTSSDGAKVPVKVYSPDVAQYGPGPYGVHINYHGGGYVFGDLTGDSPHCLSIRDNVGIVVVDVNYRHCPEAQWGKNVEDAWAALNWVRDSHQELNIDPDSISIGGISAGAVFCLILQHLARDAQIPLKMAWVSVPSTTDILLHAADAYAKAPYPSFIEYAKAPCLNWARLMYFGALAFPKEQVEEIRAKRPGWWLAPLTAPEFKGLCDTFISTAECDPLRDEGEAYGLKSIAAGNKVTMKRYLGVPHPFMHIKHLKQAIEYEHDLNEALRAAHHRKE